MFSRQERVLLLKCTCQNSCVSGGWLLVPFVSRWTGVTWAEMFEAIWQCSGSICPHLASVKLSQTITAPSLQQSVTLDWWTGTCWFWPCRLGLTFPLVFSSFRPAVPRVGYAHASVQHRFGVQPLDKADTGHSKQRGTVSSFASVKPTDMSMRSLQPPVSCFSSHIFKAKKQHAIYLPPPPLPFSPAPNSFSSTQRAAKNRKGTMCGYHSYQ